MTEYDLIDLSDIPEITGKTKSRRNPFYERIMKHGFSITEHYTPEDVAKLAKGTLPRKIDITTLDPEEEAAMERYKQRIAMQMSREFKA